MLFGSGRKMTHGQFGMNQRLDSLTSKNQVSLWFQYSVLSPKQTNDEIKRQQWCFWADFSEMLPQRRFSISGSPWPHLVWILSLLPRVSWKHVGVIKEIPQSSRHGLAFLLYILSVDFCRSDGKKNCDTLRWDFLKELFTVFKYGLLIDEELRWPALEM